MFVGHYGVSFAAKRSDPSIPLWVLFVAVQLLDVVWAPFVLLGVEQVRIVPGFTRTNPLDLYYMPFTHSLVAAVAWSAAAAVLFRVLARRSTLQSSGLVGLAVFSHWVLDFVVHVPDLPLYDNTAKVGMGLWNSPGLAFGLEALLLFAGIVLCSVRGQLHRGRAIVFGAVMLAIQAYIFFGPPPSSPGALATTALVSYIVFAATAAVVERKGLDELKAA
jgi:hypothetical protein